jgi:hypothetical protein
MTYSTMTTRSAGYVVPASEYNQFIANDEACAVANIQAAGDLFYGTASKAGTRLAKGAYGQVLRINAAATAPEWIGGLTFIQQVVLAADGVITLAAIPGTWKQLILLYQNLRSTDNTARIMYMRFNNDSNAVYDTVAYETNSGSGAYGNWANGGGTAFQCGTSTLNMPAHNDTAGRCLNGEIHIHNPSQTTFNITWDGWSTNYIANVLHHTKMGGGYRGAAAAITQIDLYCNSADTKFDTGGQAFLYGVV